MEETSKTKKLELEELSTKLVEQCAIPKISFGYGKCNYYYPAYKIFGRVRAMQLKSLHLDFVLCCYQKSLTITS